MGADDFFIMPLPDCDVLMIHIKPKDVYRTALGTIFELYEFFVMPFGLTNARATFNRMMDRIFREHKKFVGTFFDDIIVH